jgi:hypothetical protein
MEPFAAPLPAYDYLVLDLETDAGSVDEIDAALRACWVPPSNMKTPQAIGQRWLDLVAEQKEKAALADQAPVAIVSLVGVAVGRRELRALHCLEAHPLRFDSLSGGAAIAGVEGFGSERELLVALRGLLDQFTDPETELVGHNVQGFDLKKLRYRYLRHGLRLPMALAAGGAPIFDTMRRFVSHFSRDERPFVSLDWLLKEFGIPSHKGEMDGSKVPAYIAERRFEDLIRYALQDVLVEEELYLRMTGGHDDRAEVGS